MCSKNPSLQDGVAAKLPEVPNNFAGFTDTHVVSKKQYMDL